MGALSGSRQVPSNKTKAEGELEETEGSWQKATSRELRLQSSPGSPWRKTHIARQAASDAGEGPSRALSVLGARCQDDSFTEL